MNRRILLIDADSDFRAQVIQQLARYRFDVVTRSDADEAIAEAASAPPALIVLAAETDKAGFRTFGKIKKGPLAQTSIILATRSLPPEDIAKHRAMRVHADEYVDKRSLDEDELLAKIDQLIGLGTPADDLDIPVEVDDIPMGDGDMVLDETVGEDDDRGPATIASANDPRLDQIVAAETDAAFDALLGGFGDDAPAFEASQPAPQHEEAEPSRLVAPIAADLDASSIPAVIHDGQRVDPDDDEPFDTFSRESIVPPGGVRSLRPTPQPQPVVSEPAIIVSEPAVSHTNIRLESSPAIVLDADDLQVVEDDSGGVPEPVPHPASQKDVDEASQPKRELGSGLLRTTPAEAHQLAPPVELPIRSARNPDTPTRATAPVFDLGLDAIAADAESEQSGVYDRRALRKIHELERQISQLKTELERQRASADAGGGGRSSREREFVNLRQQLIAKDDESRHTRTELESKVRELADAEDRIRGLLQAKTTLEAHAAELEQRAAADGARAGSLEGRERNLVAQLANLEQEHEAKSHALAAAESARTQLERDLASERATRAASASDAERTLRVEREQMIARHQGELSGLRLEHAGAQAIALEKQRQEHAAELAAYRNEQEATLEVTRQQLETLRQEHADTTAAARQEYAAGLDAARAAQAAAIDAARADQEAAVDQLRRDLEARSAAAVEAAQHAVRTEAEQAIAALETQHAGDLAQLRDQVAAELAHQRDAHASELDRARHDLARVTDERDRLSAERAATIARLQADAHAAEEQYASVVARMQEEHAGALATAEAARERSVAEVRGELERSRAELQNVQAAHDRARQHAAEEHAAQLAQVANEHAAAMAEREREWMTLRQDEAIANTAALAELKAELDKQAQLHGIKLDGAQQELQDVLALHDQTKQQLLVDQKRAADEQAGAHAAELAAIAEERQRAIDDAQRTQAEARAAADRANAQHREELAQQKEAADREIAEYRTALIAAKRAIDDATARHQAERETLEKDHEKHVAEMKGQHERALAVVNGEVVKVKAFGDAEHNRAMAAKEAEHDKQRKESAAEHARVVRELTSERDDLQRGLGGARDTIKRLDSELAAAVQTIADRNAELRTHAAAIAERDQRIAELRTEIQTLENENTSYQDQVLRAYQRIKSDEVRSARAKKAMAIALTALDEEAAKSDQS